MPLWSARVLSGRLEGEMYIAQSSMLERVFGDPRMTWKDRFEMARIEMDEADGDVRHQQGCHQYQDPSLQRFCALRSQRASLHVYPCGIRSLYFDVPFHRAQRKNFSLQITGIALVLLGDIACICLEIGYVENLWKEI